MPVHTTRAIRIDADPARTSKRLDISVDGKTLSQKAFQKDLGTYLPNYVFAYYSGWSSRLERHFDRPTRKHYEAVSSACILAESDLTKKTIPTRSSSPAAR